MKKRVKSKENSDDAMFVLFRGVFKVGEGWMNLKCGEFDSLAHKSVQGMNAGRSFVTFVTKTGVAHFALQFWQLKKTDHFLNVCFSIFLVKLH